MGCMCFCVCRSTLHGTASTLCTMGQKAHVVPCAVPNTACRWRTHLLFVGKDSVVTTSREFQAEMLRPLYRHSMKIIMDSLVPNHRKKQLIPDSTMEPPVGGP